MTDRKIAVYYCTSCERCHSGGDAEFHAHLRHATRYKLMDAEDVADLREFHQRRAEREGRA